MNTAFYILFGLIGLQVLVVLFFVARHLAEHLAHKQFKEVNGQNSSLTPFLKKFPYKTVLPIVFLTIVELLIGSYYIYQRTSQEPSAKISSGIENVCGINIQRPATDPVSVNGKYSLTIPLTNTRPDHAKVLVKQEAYYCDNLSRLACSDNAHSSPDTDFRTYTFAPGETKNITISTTNPKGDCGSFQVDLYIRSVNGDSSCSTEGSPVFGFFNNAAACSVSNTPTPTKTSTPTSTISITNTPTSSPTPSITGTPTNTPTGTLTITPSVTQTPSITQTVTPTNRVAFRHKTCKEGNKCVEEECSPSDKPCSSSCTQDSDCTTVKLSHKGCDANKKCVVLDGAGVDSCTSDVSCQEAPVTPETPTAATVNPTILISILGLGLVVLGLGLAL